MWPRKEAITVFAPVNFPPGTNTRAGRAIFSRSEALGCMQRYHGSSQDWGPHEYYLKATQHPTYGNIKVHVTSLLLWSKHKVAAAIPCMHVLILNYFSSLISNSAIWSIYFVLVLLLTASTVHRAVIPSHTWNQCSFLQKDSTVWVPRCAGDRVVCWIVVVLADLVLLEWGLFISSPDQHR